MRIANQQSTWLSASLQDLFYITILAALMGYTRPRQDLAKTKPMPRVLSLPLVLSLILQIAVLVVFQIAALQSLHRVPWYTRTRGTPDLRTYVAPETTVIYLLGLAQFIILALVFNKGFPHRQPLWTNTGLLISLVLQIGFLVYQLFSVDAFTVKVVQLVGRDPNLGLPTDYRAFLLLIMVVNAASALLMELICGMLLLLIYKVKEKYGARLGGGRKEGMAGVSLLQPPLISASLEPVDSYTSSGSGGHGGRGLIGTAVAVPSPLGQNGSALL
jgi:cation-transporting ATPase 13A3/4/5